MTELKNYGLLLLNVLGVVALFSICEAISYRHNFRLDFTPGQFYTLSQHSLRILDHVDKDVKILAFLGREDARNNYLRDLFWRIEERQPHITTRFVDLNRNPALARAYHADAYGSVIVECGARRKSFSNAREEILMAAILQVTRDYEKYVYVLSGHGEGDITDADRKKGYSTLSNVLEHEFYHVKPLSLFGSQEIPPDAAAIIVLGARRDLLPEEASKLDHYLRSGGSMLVLLDPGASPSMAAFLRRYRVDLPAEMIGESDNQLSAGEAITSRIADKSRASSVTSTSDDPLFSLFGPINVLPGDEEDIDVLPLLSTSKSSWAIPLRGRELPENLEFDSKRGDRRGPFVVGVSVALRIAGSEPAKEDQPVQKAGRIIVFSDADFASNEFIEMLGNRDLVVNSVNWLALEDTLIGVRPERRIAGKEEFYLSSRQNYALFMLGVVILPSVFVALGSVVFVRRRMN
jgi:gliding motility-associatede transport system auxiliary component